jgi:DNA-binding IclR family transcriptional regulator
VVDARVDAPAEQGETVLLTLQRGLSVLEAVAASNGNSTAKAISRQLGLNLSTTYHLLRTLRACGYVVRLPGGVFDVGPSSAALSRRLQLRSGPPPEISALLARLHNKTQDSTYICGWFQGAITLQQFIEGVRTLSVQTLEAGYTGHMHARASCKAILAYLPEEQVEMMFSGVDLPAITAHTVVDYDGLVCSLAQIRRQGYALDLEEFADDVCCVSAPFFDPTGFPVGSFTVSVPASRFRTMRDKLIADTRDVAVTATNLFKAGRIAAPEPVAVPRRRS